MRIKKLKTTLCLLIFLLPAISVAGMYFDTNKPCYPGYFGVTGGYGQTTWGMLVPEEFNAALAVSTPIEVSEGGGLWGIYAGYEVLKTFAFEASYMHYPDAFLTFDESSLFWWKHNTTKLTSHTESVSGVAKLMVLIPCTRLRGYASFGAAGVHRYDKVADCWRLSPTFGAGLNYNLTERFMLEFGTEYVAGYGQSEIEPDEHYVPFLYSGFFRLAYRFC